VSFEVQPEAYEVRVGGVVNAERIYNVVLAAGAEQVLIPEERELVDCRLRIRRPTEGVDGGWLDLRVVDPALGIEVLEVHFTLSREMFGPDVVASVTTAELRQLVDGVRFIETMRAHPVDKAQPLEAARPLRAIFMKSVVAARDLPAGSTLGADDLAAKKPGSGIPARELPSLIGRRLRRAVARDALLSKDDLE